MKKAILIFMILVPLAIYAGVPFGVRKADVQDYKEYVDYCNNFVPVEVWQIGRAKLDTFPDGSYQDSTGHYKINPDYKILWYVLDIPKRADDFKNTVQKPINMHEGLNPDSVAGYHAIINGQKIPVGYKALINPITVYLRQRKHSVRDFYEYWQTDSIKH